MDRCYYCDREYHPMPVWSRDLSKSDLSDGKPFTIYVCTNNVIKADSKEAQAVDEDDVIRRLPERGLIFVKSGCKARAEADGYKPRKDLTPSR